MLNQCKYACWFWFSFRKDYKRATSDLKAEEKMYTFSDVKAAACRYLLVSDLFSAASKWDLYWF